MALEKIGARIDGRRFDSGEYLINAIPHAAGALAGGITSDVKRVRHIRATREINNHRQQRNPGDSDPFEDPDVSRKYATLSPRKRKKAIEAHGDLSSSDNWNELSGPQREMVTSHVFDGNADMDQIEGMVNGFAQENRINGGLPNGYTRMGNRVSSRNQPPGRNGASAPGAVADGD